jgi:hypothetical protein
VITQKPAWSIGARQGPLRRHKQLVFFACEGLLAMYDERENKQEHEYCVITPAEALERVRALGQFAKQIAADDSPWMREEARLCEKAANDLSETIKEARFMGDPSDPAIQAYWTKHRRNATVSLSAGSDAAGYPQLPSLPRGKFTGRTATPDAVRDAVAANASHVRLHRPPRKKNRTGLLLDI